MRFTNETGLMQILKYSSQRLTRILTVPVTNGYRKLRRLLNPNGFTTRVMADVRKGGKELISGKPQSLKDYFSIGNYYIAKKLVFLAAALAMVLPILYLKFLYPVIKTHFLTTPMVVNSTEMMGYNGKVKLLSGPHGTVLYQGPLVDGRITGEGKLCDYDGNLTYQGSFLLEQYEGSGQTYWPSGKARYVGAFSGSQYEGRGTLYTEDGSLLYEGDFASGLYDGEGTLYQDGAVLYRGGFKAGEMEGAGTLYSGSRVVYEGGFAAGAFSGAGREYDPVAGRLIYDGTYAAGQYEGEGKQFDADTGALAYEGGFYQGAWEGEGKRYDPQTQLPLYEGAFRAGRYDGEGVEYADALGVPLYRGGFLMGVYHGEGTQYDPITGFVTASGQYRNGQLVVVGADGLAVGEVTAPSAPPTETGGVGGQTGAEGPGGAPGETDGQTGTESPGATPGETPSGTAPGGAETQPGGSAGEGGAQIYKGPTTPAGGIDYGALAAMTGAQAQAQFGAQPTSWKTADGSVQVYSDQTEGIGVSLHLDGGGKLVSVDVWNDAPVDGAKTGMSRSELTSALGSPTGNAQKTMGEGRMLSVSQANRYFGRLTNLSPESQVTVYTYKTDLGTVQAIFAGSSDKCLLLEIIP